MPDIRTSAPHTRRKRRRGGQPGNQNARKHGFYSRTLAPAQASELFHITNVESIDTEEAVFRLKLRSVLQYDPGNRRVLGEALKVLIKWLCARYEPGTADKQYLKKLARSILAHSDRFPRNKELLQNESICPGPEDRSRKAGQKTFNKTNQTYFNN